MNAKLLFSLGDYIGAHIELFLVTPRPVLNPMRSDGIPHSSRRRGAQSGTDSLCFGGNSGRCRFCRNVQLSIRPRYAVNFTSPDHPWFINANGIICSRMRGPLLAPQNAECLSRPPVQEGGCGCPPSMLRACPLSCLLEGTTCGFVRPTRHFGSFLDKVQRAKG